MAVTYNMKGTSPPSFAIGKSGPRIFTSSSDPSGSETVSNSDLWVDTTNYQLKIRVSGAWKQVGETVETLSASTLAITGDLTVSGTTTSINSTVLDVNDNKITLNSDYTADPTQDAGIVINRGTATDVELRWNETTDKWQFTNDGTTYNDLGTSDIVNDTTPQLGGTLDVNNQLIQFGDSSGATVNRLQLGASQDLSIYHDGTDSYISNKTGDLYIGGNADGDVGGDVYIRSKIGETDTSIRLLDDSAITLYQNGSSAINVATNFVQILGNRALQLEHTGGSPELIFNHNNGNETKLIGSGTDARTITLPDATGTVALTSNIPTAVSELTNDSGFITSETDSQQLSFSNPNLTISSGNTVDLSGLDTMPSQTGHSGKFLTTDGTDPSWDYVLPEAGDDWGSIASSSDGDIQFGALTGDNSLWNGLDLGYITEKIAHSDLSVTTASASGSGGLSYDSSTGVFTFTPAAINTFDGTFNSLTSKPTTLAGYGITDGTDLVDDTTPQLGGNLDLNSNNITGTGDINITGDFQSDTATIANIPFSTSGSTSIIDKNGALNIRGNWIRFQKPGTNTDMIIAKPDGAVELYHNGTEVFSTTSTGATITNTSTDDALLITTTEDSSSAGPVLSLKRDSSSPANADYLGQIKFKGENSSGAEKNYAKITGKILDVTDGSEDGMLEFAFIKGGSQNISGRFRSDQLQLLNGTKLYIGGAGTIQFEGDSSNAHETSLQVTEPTQDNTITLPNSTGTVALTNSFSRFHSSAQTVTSSQETTNVSATVDFTFSELTDAIHYNVFLNRTLLRPTEFSVAGTTVTISVGVLAQDDELEVTGFTV